MAGRPALTLQEGILLGQGDVPLEVAARGARNASASRHVALGAGLLGPSAPSVSLRGRVAALKRAFAPDVVHANDVGPSLLLHLQTAAGHPSPWLLTLEAALMACPLVATRVGGLPPPAPAGKLPYEPPRLSVYRDMGDLLALDPPAPGLTDIPWKAPPGDPR